MDENPPPRAAKVIEDILISWLTEWNIPWSNRTAFILARISDNYGDIITVSLVDVGNLYLSRGSYLAHVGDCRLTTRYGGMKGVFAKTGLFLLQVSGTGTLFCQTYGAIKERQLAEGEQFFIDNRYVIAFSETISYQLVKASRSLRDSMLSGEGLVNRYTGPGRLYYQTRVKPSISILGHLLNAAT